MNEARDVELWDDAGEVSEVRSTLYRRDRPWAHRLLVALQHASPAPVRLMVAVAFCGYRLSTARRSLPDRF